MDFLLIVVRRLLLTNSRHVKVILMSATMDTTEVNFGGFLKVYKKLFVLFLLVCPLFYY